MDYQRSYSHRNGEEVNISIDGLTQSNSSTINGVTRLERSQLGAGRYHINIQIGECTFDINPFILSAEEPELTYLKEDGDTCIYQSFCGDTYLGEFKERVELRLEEGESLKGCKVPVYCNDRFIRNASAGKKTVFVGEYLKLIEEAERRGIITSVEFTNLFSFTGDEQLCRKVKFCQANFDVTRTWDPIFSLGETTGESITDENNCLHVQCDRLIGGGYTACPNDISNLDLPGVDINDVYW